MTMDELIKQHVRAGIKAWDDTSEAERAELRRVESELGMVLVDFDQVLKGHDVVSWAVKDHRTGSVLLNGLGDHKAMEAACAEYEAEEGVTLTCAEAHEMDAFSATYSDPEPPEGLPAELAENLHELVTALYDDHRDVLVAWVGEPA